MYQLLHSHSSGAPLLVVAQLKFLGKVGDDGTTAGRIHTVPPAFREQNHKKEEKLNSDSSSSGDYCSTPYFEGFRIFLTSSSLLMMMTDPWRFCTSAVAKPDDKLNATMVPLRGEAKRRRTRTRHATNTLQNSAVQHSRVQ